MRSSGLASAAQVSAPRDLASASAAAVGPMPLVVGLSILGRAARRRLRQRACIARTAAATSWSSSAPSSSSAAAASPSEAGQRRPLAKTEEASWEKIDDCSFLLRPPRGVEPRAILLFVGGALVGAAPQFTYSRFLSQLAARGFCILAVSYATAIDYVSVADMIETRFTRALAGSKLGDLPVWGLGHSLGALAQVLISSRHPSGRRKGQILIAYTRRGEEALPVVRTVLRANPVLGPLLSSLDVGVASEFLMKGVEFVERALPGRQVASGAGGAKPVASSVVRDVVPLLQQMLPLLREVGVEQDSFRPSEGQLTRAISQGYREQNTLLVRLGGDGLDETPVLAGAMSGLPADRGVDFTVKTLRSQHFTPLLPDWQEGTPFSSPFLQQSALSRGGWSDTADDQTAIVDAIDAYIAAHP